MDYFTDETKLLEIQRKLRKVGLEVEVHYHEAGMMTTYHVVKKDKHAGMVKRAFGLDVELTLATETSTHAISRVIDNLLSLPQVAHEHFNLRNHSRWFGV